MYQIQFLLHEDDVDSSLKQQTPLLPLMVVENITWRIKFNILEARCNEFAIYFKQAHLLHLFISGKSLIQKMRVG